VSAKGFAQQELHGVVVRDDGPTYLDVELRPRS